jgi:hypothetical protein
MIFGCSLLFFLPEISRLPPCDPPDVDAILIGYAILENVQADVYKFAMRRTCCARGDTALLRVDILISVSA